MLPTASLKAALLDSAGHDVVTDNLSGEKMVILQNINDGKLRHKYFRERYSSLASFFVQKEI
jgi:hypothetical protein